MNEERPVDPLPGFIAGVDQMMKMAPMLARLARSQYRAYREEGFSPKQALYLTACIARAPEPPDEEEE